ncbi:hypothetical protein I7I48_09335 [Histoplasma ohiense]|nr:hypothetical protein I7I48_09335 [Histoplasma ohiense (nom. inval.)]
MLLKSSHLTLYSFFSQTKAIVRHYILVRLLLRTSKGIPTTPAGVYFAQPFLINNAPVDTSARSMGW